MLVNYSSDSEEEEQNQQKRPSILVNPTPYADTSRLDLQHQLKVQKIMQEIEQQNKPQEISMKDPLTGKVAIVEYIDQVEFEKQFIINKLTLNQESIKKNEESKEESKDNANNPQQIQQINMSAEEIRKMSEIEFKKINKEESQKAKLLKKKREKAGTPGVGDYKGPWAQYEQDTIQSSEMTAEEKEKFKKIEEKRKQKQEDEVEKQEYKAYSEYYGGSSRDYQGRSYIMPPSDIKENNQHDCYIPKKCIHVYSGHTKGVQCIKFFPRFGHFLLSGSLDSTIRLWSTLGNKQCVRGYFGHTAAVRDLNFSNDGKHFLSCGYDKLICYWDTEYGKVIQHFKIKGYPYCVRMNPDPSKQHLFLLGSSSKKIGQYDVKAGTRTLQYDEHLGAINTITFVDNSKKFVSSSDDKKVFLWEFGLPIVVKHISEPDMHSIVYTALHPSHKYLAAHQPNSKIIVYDVKGGNIRPTKKKQFTGHNSEGYAIGIQFSPDGQFLASGDADGKAYFWDWKGCKNFRVLDAHNGVCMGIDWNPLEPSKVATCGWDGLIKYWD